MTSTSTMFVALQEAAEICRAAVAISAVEPAPEDDRGSLAQLVFGAHAEAYELEREWLLARETAAMMD